MEELEMCHSIQVPTRSKKERTVEYDVEMAGMMASYICYINNASERRGIQFAECFGQQYNLKQGLKRFGERGKKALRKELDQLHQRVCFTPVDVSTMSQDERDKCVDAIMLLTEKMIQIRW